MKTLRFNILGILALIGIVAFAEPKLTISVANQVIEGQKFTVTYRVTDGKTNPPRQPNIENCEYIYGPSVSTMSSTQIINGQISSSVSYDYTYTYQAVKAGTVTIPAVTVNVDGKELSAGPKQLTILPPDSNRQGGAGGGGQQGVQPNNPAQPTREISPQDMFVRISVSKNSVYEQEPVIATVKVYTRYNISQFRITTQPTFEGFLSEELDVSGSTEMEHYNGQNYYTAVLKRCILYPQKAGKLTINSGKYEVTILQRVPMSNGFFTTYRNVEQQVSTQSNTATVNVQALPEPKPYNFSGAVGSYTAQVKLTPTELRTNEAANYVYTISGSGNIKYLTAPTIDFPHGIDRYTPKTDINARFNGSNMQGQFVVNYTLVPQEPGNYEIETPPFVYFDVATKEYKTVEFEPYEMRVAQGAMTSAVTEQRVIDKSMTDIHHIKTGNATDQTKRPHYAFHSTIYWMLYLILVLSLVTVVLVYRRHLTLKADVRGRKLARASRVANQRLRAAKALIHREDADKFYAELNRALWGYISDKLGIPSSQLVRDNIATQLEAYGASDDAIHNIISILDDCEMARFTPSHSDSEMMQLYNKAVAAIGSIEDVKR